MSGINNCIAFTNVTERVPAVKVSISSKFYAQIFHTNFTFWLWGEIRTKNSCVKRWNRLKEMRCVNDDKPNLDSPNKQQLLHWITHLKCKPIYVNNFNGQFFLVFQYELPWRYKSQYLLLHLYLAYFFCP